MWGFYFTSWKILCLRRGGGAIAIYSIEFSSIYVITFWSELKYAKALCNWNFLLFSWLKMGKWVENKCGKEQNINPLWSYVAIIRKTLQNCLRENVNKWLHTFSRRCTRCDKLELNFSLKKPVQSQDKIHYSWNKNPNSNRHITDNSCDMKKWANAPGRWRSFVKSKGAQTYKW